MKIGILTQPLYANYGGLLQAYALQKHLKRMGHEVLTIDRVLKQPTYLRILFSILKRAFFHYILRRKGNYPIIPPLKKRHTSSFVQNYISTTHRFNSNINKSLQLKYNFDAYIVGSDQVWRPRYSPYLPNYFFNFLVGINNVKRIAYAVSFGVSDWEFTDRQTVKCSTLAKQFDAISVREDSAIKLCKDHLGVDAVHVVDPTMLLEKEDYIDIIGVNRHHQDNEKLSTYILDESEETNKIVHEIAQQLNLVPDEKISHQIQSKLKNSIVPPVEDWLCSFVNAKYVVTDSFHGTVLSIIFNKPFIVIGNLHRGITRFSSLLKMFNLENRMILNFGELTTEKIISEIDWKLVNNITKKEQTKARSFIENALKS